MRKHIDAQLRECCGREVTGVRRSVVVQEKQFLAGQTGSEGSQACAHAVQEIRIVGTAYRRSFRKVINEHYSVAIPKNGRHNLAGRKTLARCAGRLLTREDPLPSGLPAVRSEVMNPGFIHGQQAAPKIARIPP